jgi:hypothetical protein
MFQRSRAANRVRVLIALTLGKSKRAQGMPGDGLTHGPPATKKQAASPQVKPDQPAFPARWF